MSLKAAVAQGMKWQAINIIGRQLLSLIVFTTLARLLDPAAFGLVALVAVYQSLVLIVADFGVGVALIQRKNLEPEHINTAFWFNAFVNALLCVATILVAAPIADILGEPKLTSLLRWASVGLMLGALSTIQARLFVKNLDFRRPAFRTFIANIAGGAVGVGMAVAGCGVWSLIGQQIASALAGSGFLWLASDYRPSLSFSVRHLRELLGVGSSAFANAFIWFFSSRLDQIIIGRFAGVPALGLYVIANKLPEIIKSVTQQPLTDVSVPALSRLQDDHARMREVICRGMELNSVVVFPVFVGLAAVSNELLPLLFGAQWIQATGMCALLSLYAIISALQIFFYPALLAAGVTARYVCFNAAFAVGVCTAAAVGVRFGVTYVICGLILNSLIFCVPAAIMLRQRIGLTARAYYRPCGRPASASVAMFAIVWIIKHLLPDTFPEIGILVAEILAGVISYIAIMFIIDRSALKNLLDTGYHALGRSKAR